MAAFRLNASVRAVSCKVNVFPTLRTSIPSVVIPTLNSGCSLIPCSIISAGKKKVENFNSYSIFDVRAEMTIR